MSEAKKDLKTKIAMSIIILFSFMCVGGIFFAVTSYAQDTEHTAQTIPVQTENSNVKAYGLISAALAFGLGTIGAGIAIANVGSAAMGAVAEKPEIAGQAIIFVALAEGLVVFSFITALMILGKV